PQERLRAAADFRRAFDRRRVVSDQAFVIHSVENGLEYSRIGIVVSRKVSRRAVVRHRIKRLVREVFRLNKAAFCKGIDFVIVARVALVSFKDVHSSLIKLATESSQRLRGDTPATKAGTGV